MSTCGEEAKHNSVSDLNLYKCPDHTHKGRGPGDMWVGSGYDTTKPAWPWEEPGVHIHTSFSGIIVTHIS